MCSVLAAPGADGGVGKARQAGYLQHRTGHQFGHGITISMDGKGAWRDNVFVERLWRSVKYDEEVYLHAYDSVSEARSSIGCCFDFLQLPKASAALTASHPIKPAFTLLPLRMAP
jgi:putative transposase